MKRLRFAIFLSFIILLSCNKHPSKSFPDLIIGTWERSMDLRVEAPLPGVDKIKFTFMRDSGIFHPGFYYLTAIYTEIGFRKFISYKFTYSFRYDTLSMICPDEHDSIGTEIINYKVLEINKDSLIAETNKNLILRFARVTN
jgi:hypothetical protein